MKEHRAPFITAAWGLIIVFVAGMAVLQALPEKVEKGESQDPTGLVMIQLQGEYLLGVASLLGASQEIAQQATILDIGTVEQRQRYMAFMLALGDPNACKTVSAPDANATPCIWEGTHTRASNSARNSGSSCTGISTSRRYTITAAATWVVWRLT